MVLVCCLFLWWNLSCFFLVIGLAQKNIIILLSIFKPTIAVKINIPVCNVRKVTIPEWNPIKSDIKGFCDKLLSCTLRKFHFFQLPRHHKKRKQQKIIQRYYYCYFCYASQPFNNYLIPVFVPEYTVGFSSYFYVYTFCCYLNMSDLGSITTCFRIFNYLLLEAAGR